jgi:hypothetical protein
MTQGTEKRNTGKKEERGDEIDPKLLDLLVCPLTKAPLHFDRERCELVSEAAKLAYPVRGGVPIMLPSEARSLDNP